MPSFRWVAIAIGAAIFVVLVGVVGTDEALAATARALGWRSLLVCLPFGVGFALALAVDARLVSAMLWLLLVELIGAGGFLIVQVAGLVSRGARRLARFGALRALAAAEDLDQTLQAFYRRRWRRFGVSVGFHLLGWFMGVVETWLFLRVLQVRASLATALVIETLGSAVRFATFFVPGSLGALEGANTAAFAALGLGAQAGLAFSLLRRLRQAVWIGLGGLVLVLAHRGARPAPKAAARSEERRVGKECRSRGSPCH